VLCVCVRVCARAQMYFDCGRICVISLCAEFTHIHTHIHAPRTDSTRAGGLRKVSQSSCGCPVSASLRPSWLLWCRQHVAARSGPWTSQHCTPRCVFAQMYCRVYMVRFNIHLFCMWCTFSYVSHAYPGSRFMQIKCPCQACHVLDHAKKMTNCVHVRRAGDALLEA
jgi:hypothetical protein